MSINKYRIDTKVGNQAHKRVIHTNPSVKKKRPSESTATRLAPDSTRRLETYSSACLQHLSMSRKLGSKPGNKKKLR